METNDVSLPTRVLVRGRAGAVGLTLVTDPLARLAPALRDAIEVARAKAYLTLDGTLLPIDGIAADRPYRKHGRHWMTCRCWANPLGRLPWASPALPGAVHEVTTACTHGITDALAATGLRVRANKGYQSTAARPTCPTAAAGGTSRRKSAPSTTPTRRSAPSANPGYSG